MFIHQPRDVNVILGHHPSFSLQCQIAFQSTRYNSSKQLIPASRGEYSISWMHNGSVIDGVHAKGVFLAFPADSVSSSSFLGSYKCSVTVDGLDEPVFSREGLVSAARELPHDHLTAIACYDCQTENTYIANCFS